MIFNSFVFVAFFSAVYAAYLGLRGNFRWQNRLLLGASYVFYGYWDWRFLSLILLSTTVDFVCGKRIAEPGSSKKLFLTISVVVNLGLLGIFKYLGFFAESAVQLLRALGMQADHVTLNIILPVGISFYTFQTLSYTIDIYRDKLEPCRDILDFGLFVAFFPQLVAGPIERAARFLPQVTSQRTITRAGLEEGIWLIAWGYYKKVFVADNVAILVDSVFASPGASGGEVLVAIYAFAIQIYCDFSGYSDIARGLAKVMGFDLMLNFNLPYFAKDPSDFWRRWHISLSTWLRDYLYISLGGNRGGRWRTYRNLFLTMLLGGLWHGAAWTFVAWGVFHGIILIIYRGMPSIPWPEGRVAGTAKDAFSVLLMFHLTCVSWLLFRADSLGQVSKMAVEMFRGFRITEAVSQSGEALLGFSAVLVLVQIGQYFKNDLLFPIKLARPLQGVAYGIILYFVLMHGAVSDSFIYFQF